MHPPDLLPNLKELEGVNLCCLRDFLKKEIDLRKDQLDAVAVHQDDSMLMPEEIGKGVH